MTQNKLKQGLPRIRKPRKKDLRKNNGGFRLGAGRRKAVIIDAVGVDLSFRIHQDKVKACIDMVKLNFGDLGMMEVD